MVIPRIFNRRIHSISYPIRVKCQRNGATKRLFLKQIENSGLKTLSKKFRSYEADGKTFGVVINKKNSEELTVDHLSRTSFFMPSGAEFVGSMIIFPHAIFSWHVTSAKDVNEDSLVLFKLMEPKIDILVFGYGARHEYTTEVRLNFTKCCKNLGIRFEALPTEQAIGTFNFLATERRLVAGALIPPATIDVLKFDRSRPLYLDDEEEDEDEELKAIEDGAIKKLK